MSCSPMRLNISWFTVCTPENPPLNVKSGATLPLVSRPGVPAPGVHAALNPHCARSKRSRVHGAVEPLPDTAAIVPSIAMAVLGPTSMKLPVPPPPTPRRRVLSLKVVRAAPGPSRWKVIGALPVRPPLVSRKPAAMLNPSCEEFKSGPEMDACAGALPLALFTRKKCACCSGASPTLKVANVLRITGSAAGLVKTLPSPILTKSPAALKIARELGLPMALRSVPPSTAVVFPSIRKIERALSVPALTRRRAPAVVSDVETPTPTTSSSAAMVLFRMSMTGRPAPLKVVPPASTENSDRLRLSLLPSILAIGPAKVTPESEFTVISARSSPAPLWFTVTRVNCTIGSGALLVRRSNRASLRDWISTYESRTTRNTTYAAAT